MRLAARFVAVPVLLVLGACSAWDTDSFKAPDADTLFRRTSVTNLKEKVLPPVAPEDLVDASGRCAGASIPAAAEGTQPQAQTNVSLQDAGVPTIPTAIALDMTECDVVKRAGFPERVEIGSNAGNERSATLTYLGGPRPGIYRFAAGRLKSMERAPEPPAPAKPVKRAAKPAAKPKPSARQATTVTVN